MGNKESDMNNHLFISVTTFLVIILINIDAQYLRKYSHPDGFEKDVVKAIQNDICGNGICDIGENCHSCPVDCINGTSGGFTCGNGICEDGESCETCPEDCNSDSLYDNYCCYGGPEVNQNEIKHGVSCASDIRCGQRAGKCSTEASPLVDYCCGDGVCTGDETQATCAVDNCVNLCGNFVCDIDQGETADSCGMDCKCNLDGICDAWESSTSCPLDCHCGNFVCDYELGENADNCPADCTKGCDEMEEMEDGIDEDYEMKGMDHKMEKITEDVEEMHHHMGNMDYEIEEMVDGTNDMHHHKVAIENEMGNNMDDHCVETGETCSTHKDCCSFACDNSLCVG